MKSLHRLFISSLAAVITMAASVLPYSSASAQTVSEQTTRLTTPFGNETSSGGSFSADGALLTTPFRIRSGASNNYLVARGRSIAVAPLVENDDSFLWVLDTAERPYPNWSRAEDSNWYFKVDVYSGGSDSRFYKIANLKQGFYLTKSTGSNSVSVTASQPGALQLWQMLEAPDARSKYKTARAWEPYEYEPLGAVLFVSAPNIFQPLRTDVGGLSQQGAGVTIQQGQNFNDPSWTWHLEEAPKRDLAKLTIDSVTAFRTSTGQDGNTRFMFDAIEGALEYGPGVYSLGASSGLAASAMRAGAAIAKKAGSYVGKEIAKKMAQRAAYNSLSAFGKASVAAAEKKAIRAAAQKAAWMAWAREGRQQTSTVLTKQAAKEMARRARLVAVKQAYSEVASLAGVKGGKRVVTRVLFETAFEAKSNENRNKNINRGVNAIVEAFSDEEKADAGDEAFQQLIASTDKAAGRNGGDGEGLIETLFSPFIDDTVDDLEIEVNGVSIWPNGGDDHREIASGETKDVSFEYIFDRQKGIDIHLIEYDSGSNDDSLGHLRFSTADLDGAELYEDAYIKHEEEGSLYGMTFVLESLYLPTEQETDIQDQIARELDEEERKIKAAEFLTFVDKRNGDVRAGIVETFGADALAAYDNTQSWGNEREEACKNKPDDYGPVISGDWRVGHYNERGEKDRSTTWTYTFAADGTFITPHATGSWRRSYFPRAGLSQQQRDNEAEFWGHRTCGVFIRIQDDNDQMKPVTSRSSGPEQEFLPVHLLGSEAFAARYDEPDSTASQVIATVRQNLSGVNYEAWGVKSNVQVKADGGLGLWMEKMSNPGAKTQESAASSEKTEKDMVGTWVIGRYRAPNRETDETQDRLPPNDWRFWDGSKKWDWVNSNWMKPSERPELWTFTSDHIFIGENPGHTGSWQPVGDRRVRVKTVFDYSGLGKEFTINLDLPPYEDGFHIQSPSGTKAFYGDNESHQVTRLQMAPGQVIKLAELRASKRVPLPVEEVADLADFEAWHKKIADDLARAELDLQERERLSNEEQALRVIGNRALEVLRNTVDLAQCGATGMQDASNLLGEWTVGLYDSPGNKLDLPAGEATWTFNPNGTLTGFIGQNAWTANWFADNGCFARASFDSATATHFNLENEVEIRLDFKENGDKEFYILEPDQNIVLIGSDFPRIYDKFSGKTLAASGTKPADEEDLARFILKYDERIITRGGIANRCSSRWQNSKIRPGNEPQGWPVGLDVRATGSSANYRSDEQISVFKVNFAGPEAELLGIEDFTEDMRVGDIKTRSFAGVAGDEFVILDNQNKCLKVIDTEQLLTPVRDRISFGYGSSAETSVYHLPTSVANGCSSYQWAHSAEYLYDDARRKIGNSGSGDLFVYQVDSAGVYSGQNPVLTIAPGQLQVLDARLGQQFTILDSASQCVAVTDIRKDDELQLVYGNGSTPIQDPDFLTAVQIANGCENFNKVSSKASTSEGSARIANNSSGAIFAYWVDYRGAWDIAHPALTIEPGETAQLVDYQGARYTVLDQGGLCMAVIELGYGNFEKNQRVVTLGDGSTLVDGRIFDPLSLNNGVQTGSLSETQTANGCALFGRIASRPSSNMGWNRTIKNEGASPLSVYWVSFYGANEDGEYTRSPIPLKTLEQYESLKLDNTTYSDVYSVVDNRGECVAVVQASDQMQGTGAQANRMFSRTYYALRDNDSIRALEQELAQEIPSAPETIIEPERDLDGPRDYALVPDVVQQECQSRHPNSPADDEYYYDCMDIALANVGQVEQALPVPETPVEPLQDERVTRDYSQVSTAAEQDCSAQYPNSPADDRYYFDCMDIALATVGQIEQALPVSDTPAEPLQDLRVSTDYGLVPPAAEQECSAQYPNSPADDRYYFDCMDIALASVGDVEQAGPDQATVQANCRASFETDAAVRQCVQEQMGPDWIDPGN